MSVLSAVAKLLPGLGKVADELHLGGEEKHQLRQNLLALLQEFDTEQEQSYRDEINAKVKLMLAEIKSEDKVTRRTRPGLAIGIGIIFFINYGVIPLVNIFKAVPAEPVVIPELVVIGLLSVVTAYGLGRSKEKMNRDSLKKEMLTG